MIQLPEALSLCPLSLQFPACSVYPNVILKVLGLMKGLVDDKGLAVNDLVRLTVIAVPGETRFLMLLSRCLFHYYCCN